MIMQDNIKERHYGDQRERKSFRPNLFGLMFCVQLFLCFLTLQIKTRRNSTATDSNNNNEICMSQKQLLPSFSCCCCHDKVIFNLLRLDLIYHPNSFWCLTIKTLLFQSTALFTEKVNKSQLIHFWDKLLNVLSAQSLAIFHKEILYLIDNIYLLYLLIIFFNDLCQYKCASLG